MKKMWRNVTVYTGRYQTYKAPEHYWVSGLRIKLLGLVLEFEFEFDPTWFSLGGRVDFVPSNRNDPGWVASAAIQIPTVRLEAKIFNDVWRVKS